MESGELLKWNYGIKISLMLKFPVTFRLVKTERGEFQFGYVHGFLDCHYSDEKQKVEFSWEGNDEMDPASGRGFAMVKNGILLGHLFFH